MQEEGGEVEIAPDVVEGDLNVVMLEKKAQHEQIAKREQAALRPAPEEARRTTVRI